MNLFSSDAFLTSLAEVFFPGHRHRVGHYSTDGQVFRLMSVDGAGPITIWDFMDSVAPVPGSVSGPVSRLRHLPRVALRMEDVTAIPEQVINGPDYFPAPLVRWSCFRDWEDFESHFARRRHNLVRDSRSKRRHLEQAMGPLRFTFHDTRAEVFDTCIRWKSAQYVRTGVPDLFSRRGNADLFRALVRRDALAVSSLYAGERLLAVHFAGLDGDRFYSWIAAYDPDLGRFSPGRLLLEDMLRECQRREFAEFDFGIGHSDYKWYYATHNRVIGPLGRASVSQRLHDGVRVNARRILARSPSLYAAARRMRALGERGRRGATPLRTGVHGAMQTSPTGVPEAAPVRPERPDSEVTMEEQPTSHTGSAGDRPGVGCQLEAFPTELPVGPPSIQEPWLRYLRRRGQGFLLRVRREIDRLVRRPAPTVDPDPPRNLPAPTLKAGDRVRVRPAAYVRTTLDSRHSLKGCGFGTGQYQYCDREFRVLKTVDHFFDEARARMLKGNRLVLLDGVHCDGSSSRWTQGCDRMCFYFWRTEWLEKVEDGPRPEPVSAVPPGSTAEPTSGESVVPPPAEPDRSTP